MLIAFERFWHILFIWQFRYKRKLFIATCIHWMARDNYVLLRCHSSVLASRFSYTIWPDRSLIFIACKRGKGFRVMRGDSCLRTSCNLPGSQWIEPRRPFFTVIIMQRSCAIPPFASLMTVSSNAVSRAAPVRRSIAASTHSM